MRAKTLLMDRFPLLGMLSHTWGYKKPSEERLPEADLSAFFTIERGKAAADLKMEGLYVYGIGNGAVYRQLREWLREKSQRRLIFLEEEADVLAGFLEEPLAPDVLEDPQVHVAWIQSEEDLDALAEEFPFTCMEVIPLPSKRGRKASQIRLKLFRKTTLTQGLYVEREQGELLFRNFLQNTPHLARSFYANALKGAFSGVPAIVCGAGPSLQTELLKTVQEKALLIAGGSTIAALTSQGIIPHFGMAIDPNLEEGIRFQNLSAPTMPLLYSTRVFPSVLQNHAGPLGYMRGGIGGLPELWMEEEMQLTDPLLGEGLHSEALSVTALCIAWAQFLGCNPIVFNGLDLAYTNRKRYAPGVVAGEAHPSENASDQTVWRKSRTGKRVQTAVRWLMESGSISAFAQQYPETRFINTTVEGLRLKGIPFVPLEQVPLTGFVSRSEVAEKIAEAPHLTSPDLRELQESLGRVVGHLRVLAGETPGSKALAEVELQEELATSLLFHRPPADWSAYLSRAVRYNLIFMQFISQRSNANP